MPIDSSLATVDGGATVNDVTRRYPSTLPIFRALGIDSCCGGALSLAEAAKKAGIGLDVLHATLTTAVAASEQPRTV